jgi:hypothetical protein
MDGGNPSPYRTTDIRLKDLISVTAADRYTVVFKFKTLNPENIIETLHNAYQAQCLENPEAVKKWGDLTDWHHAIGTGPYILKDFVPGKSATLVKNPDYWGHDERYPQNQLPYLDSISRNRLNPYRKPIQKYCRFLFPGPRLLPYNRETTGRRLRIYGCAWRCKWRSTCRPSQKIIMKILSTRTLLL